MSQIPSSAKNSPSLLGSPVLSTAGLQPDKYYITGSPNNDQGQTWVRIFKYSRIEIGSTEGGIKDPSKRKVYGDYIDLVINNDKIEKNPEASDRNKHWSKGNSSDSILEIVTQRNAPTTPYLDDDKLKYPSFISEGDIVEIKPNLVDVVESLLTDLEHSSLTKTHKIDSELKKSLLVKSGPMSLEDLGIWILNLEKNHIGYKAICDRAYILTVSNKKHFLKEVVANLYKIRDGKNLHQELKLEDYHKLQLQLQRKKSDINHFLTSVLELHGIPTKGKVPVLGLNETDTVNESLADASEKVFAIKRHYSDLEVAFNQLKTYNNDPFKFFDADKAYLNAFALDLPNRMRDSAKKLHELDNSSSSGITYQNNLLRADRVETLLKNQISDLEKEYHSHKALRIGKKNKDRLSIKLTGIQSLLQDFQIPLNLDVSKIGLNPLVTTSFEPIGTISARQLGRTFKNLDTVFPELSSAIQRSVSKTEVYGSEDTFGEEISHANEYDLLKDRPKGSFISDNNFKAESDLIREIANQTKYEARLKKREQEKRKSDKTFYLTSGDSRLYEASNYYGPYSPTFYEKNRFIRGTGPFTPQFYSTEKLGSRKITTSKDISEEESNKNREEVQNLKGKVIPINGKDYFITKANTKEGVYGTPAQFPLSSNPLTTAYAIDTEGVKRTLEEVYKADRTYEVLEDNKDIDQFTAATIIRDGKITINRRIIPGISGKGDIQVDPNIFMFLGSPETRTLETTLTSFLPPGTDFNYEVFKKKYRGLFYQAQSIARDKALEFIKAQEVLSLGSRNPVKVGQSKYLSPEDITFAGYLSNLQSEITTGNTKSLHPFLNALKSKDVASNLAELIYSHSEREHRGHSVSTTDNIPLRIKADEDDSEGLTLAELGINKKSVEEYTDISKLITEHEDTEINLEVLQRKIIEQNLLKRRLDKSKNIETSNRLINEIDSLHITINKMSEYITKSLIRNNPFEDISSDISQRLTESIVSFDKSKSFVSQTIPIIQNVFNLKIESLKPKLIETLLQKNKLTPEELYNIHQMYKEVGWKLVFPGLKEETTGRLYGGNLEEVDLETGNITLSSGQKLGLYGKAHEPLNIAHVIEGSKRIKTKTGVIIPTIKGETLSEEEKRIQGLSTKLVQVQDKGKSYTFATMQESPYLNEESIHRFIKFNKGDFNKVAFLDIENSRNNNQIFSVGFTVLNNKLEEKRAYETVIPLEGLLEESDRTALIQIHSQLVSGGKLSLLSEEQIIIQLTSQLSSHVKGGGLISAHNAAHDFGNLVRRAEELGLTKEKEELEKIFLSHGFDTIHSGVMSDTSGGSGVQALLESLFGIHEKEKHTPVSDTRDVARIIRELWDRGLQFSKDAKIGELELVGKTIVYPEVAETPVLVTALLPPNSDIGRDTFQIYGKNYNMSTLEVEGKSKVQFNSSAWSEIHTVAQFMKSINQGRILIYDSLKDIKPEIKSILSPKLEDNMSRLVRQGLLQGSQRPYIELTGQISEKYQNLPEEEAKVFREKILSDLYSSQGESQGFSFEGLTKKLRDRLSNWMTSGIDDTYARQSYVEASQVLVERSKGIDAYLRQAQKTWISEGQSEGIINTRSELYQKYIAQDIEPLERRKVLSPIGNRPRSITLETGNIKDKILLDPTKESNLDIDTIVGIFKHHAKRVGEDSPEFTTFMALKYIDSQAEGQERILEGKETTLLEMANRVLSIANANPEYGKYEGDANDYRTQIGESTSEYQNIIAQRIKSISQKTLGKKYDLPNTTEEILNTLLSSKNVPDIDYKVSEPLPNYSEVKDILKDSSIAFESDYLKDKGYIKDEVEIPHVEVPEEEPDRIGKFKEGYLNFFSNIDETFTSLGSRIKEKLESTSNIEKTLWGSGIVAGLLLTADIARRAHENKENKESQGDLSSEQSNQVAEKQLRNESSSPRQEAVGGWRKLLVKIRATHPGHSNGERISEEAMNALSLDVSATLASHLDSDYDASNSKHTSSSQQNSENSWDISKFMDNLG